MSASCLGSDWNMLTDVEVWFKAQPGQFFQNIIEDCIQAWHIHRHLLYLHSPSLQEVLINHFPCVELSNQKTITYFTRKKKLFFFAAALVSSYLPPLHQQKEKKKVYVKIYGLMFQLMNNLGLFLNLQKVDSATSFANKHENSIFCHIPLHFYLLNVSHCARC